MKRGDFARSLVLERHRTAERLRQLEQEREALRREIGTLSRCIETLTTERDALARSEKTLVAALAKKDAELSEALRRQQGLQEDARLATLKFQEQVKRMGDGGEAVRKVMTGYFWTALVLTGGLFLTGMGILLGLRFGPFFHEFPIRSVVSGVLVLIVLGVLTLLHWSERPLIFFFPVTALILFVLTILGFLWAGVVFLPGPENSLPSN
jgi:hypothetical protein